MYASQRLEMGPGDVSEISLATRAILQLAHHTISSGRLENRFLVFPIFLAGFASTAREDRRLALNLMRQMEQESIGRNTRATRELLEIVYERQEASISQVGHAMRVDWIQVMLEVGLKVIIVGL